MKLQSSIKRLNLTLTPDDHFLIKAARAHTMFPNRSDIIREAVNLLSQLRRAASSGLRVVLRNEAEREQYPVALRSASQTEERDESPASTSPVEVRLPNADAVELDWLKTNSPGESQVEIVRQALVVYADVVEKVSARWQLLLCSQEGSMLSCPVRGIRRADEPPEPSSKPSVCSESSTECSQDLSWFRVLPARLREAVADVAESQGTTPEALVTDVVGHYIAKRQSHNTLALEPHSIEHLIEEHEKWFGESLLVAVTTILDATDFFAVLMHHLQHRVRVFYATQDRKAREQLEARLNNLPPTSIEDVRRCLHWIDVSVDHFRRNPELVIFDPLSEDKACGYVWRKTDKPTACYEVLSEPDLANALREYIPRLIDAQKQQGMVAQVRNENPNSGRLQTPKAV